MSSVAVSLPSPAARGVTFPWLPFVPLLAIPLTGTSPQDLDRVIVAMEVILLVMAISNPVWALGALTLSELTIRNYFFQFGDMQVSARLFISLVAVAIVLPYVSRRTDLGPKAKAIVIVAISFVALTTLANAVSSDFNFVFKFLRYISTGLIALFLVPLAIRNRDDVVRIGILALTIAAASAVVAVFQHYEFKGLPVLEVMPGKGVAASGGRSQGLAENPIYLTNDLMVVLFPLLGVVLMKGMTSKVGQLLLAIALIMVAALYFTQTRSWVPSAVLGGMALIMAFRGRVQKELFLLLLLSVVAFWYWTDYSGNRYSQGFGDDDSAAVRPVLWTASLNIAIDNPIIGIGHDQFLIVSPQYAETIDKDLLERQGAGDALGKRTPHNDFLNVWLSFGTAALILYGLLHFFTAVNLLNAARRFADPLLKGIALGALGALVAMSVNALFHNFFDSTLTIWILAGLSLALTKLAREEARLKPGPTP